MKARWWDGGDEANDEVARVEEDSAGAVFPDVFESELAGSRERPFARRTFSMRCAVRLLSVFGADWSIRHSKCKIDRKEEQKQEQAT